MNDTGSQRGTPVLKTLARILFSIALAGSVWAENNTDYIFNGPGQTTNYGGALYIPMSSPGTNNTLQILNGGSVTNNGGAIGNNSGDNYNTAIVSGAGSLWYNSADYSIGSVGSDNLLLITNAGTAKIQGNAYIGSTGSFSNRVIVTDPGSVWNMGLRLYAGYAGTAASLIITNGGIVTAQDTWEGGWPGTGNHSIVVTGPGSLLSNSFDMWMGVYTGSGGDQVTVANGGRILTATTIVGYADGNNVVTITGSGSMWSNTSYFYFGSGGTTGNQLIVQSGGTLRSDGGIYPGYSASNTVAVVTGPGSLLDAGSGIIEVGAYAPNNTLIISNGARAVASESYLGGVGGSNNVLLVTGAGSVMSNSGSTYVGYVGPSDKMIIANGGRVDSASAYIGWYDSAPNNWFGDNGAVEVAGTGSVWNIRGNLYVSYLAYGGQIVVTNGGRVNVGNEASIGQADSNANVVVTGPGSTFHVDGFLTVGNNGVYSVGDNSHLLLTDGGTLETWDMLAGSSPSAGSISNLGGVFQFTSNVVYVTLYGAGTIMMSNATVSYLNVNGADINNPYVGLISKQGDNTFQLNNSTNAFLGSYTFDSSANTGNQSNYYRLALVHGGSRWQSSTLTIGSGGILLVSDSAAASVSGVVSNAGTILVTNSKVTFENKLAISGSYQSDPSTSTFLDDVTIDPSGSMAGVSGDGFDFKKSFFNNSTNTSVFDLSHSLVSFSGGGVHTNAVTGVDLGHDATIGYPNGFVATNFSYGRLTLGSSNDIVYFTSGNGASSNALYVGELDLVGLTNEFSSVASMITNLFHSPTSINIYYAATSVDPFNSYLNDQTFNLTDLGGGFGGLLMPAVPEPSMLAWFGFGFLALCWRRRRR